MTTKRTIQNSVALPAVLRHFLLLTIALLGLAMPMQSYADEGVQSAGKVIFVFGKAWRHSLDGGRYDIKRGMAVKVGDTIETSATGQVQIRMNDNGLISIRPSSQFKIKAFKFSGAKGADSAEDKTYFQLLKGGFRSITGTVGENNKKAYKVVTPVATIGIRGTDYSARLCDGDCNRADGLYVGVWRGGVSLTNEAGVLNVDAGQFGFVPDMLNPGKQVDNLPAGMLLAGSGVRAGSAGGETATTTIAEFAANDIALIEPSLVSLPTTGTASYNLANISATNTTGDGIAIGSASLNANFTAMTVDASVNLTMNDAVNSTWNGSSTGMSLQNNGSFSGTMSTASSTNSGLGGTSLSAGGSFDGNLTGMGDGTVPTGATLNFNMDATYISGSDSVSGQASSQ
jgi:hypothetical protein